MNYWPTDVKNQALVAQANRISEQAARGGNAQQPFNFFVDQQVVPTSTPVVLNDKKTELVVAVVPANNYSGFLATSLLILFLSAVLGYAQLYVVFAYYNLVSSTYWMVNFMSEFTAVIMFAGTSVLIRMFMLPFIRRVSSKIVNVYAKDETTRRQRDDIIVAGTWSIVSSYSVGGAWNALARASVIATLKVVEYLSYVPMLVIVSIFLVCIAQRMPEYFVSGPSPVESVFNAATKIVWGPAGTYDPNNGYYQTITEAYNHYFRPNANAQYIENTLAGNPPPVNSVYSSWPRK
jgi:hypothetical protein